MVGRHEEVHFLLLTLVQGRWTTNIKSILLKAWFLDLEGTHRKSCFESKTVWTSPKSHPMVTAADLT